MNDNKLKLILTILSAFIFALIFILIAFVVPIENKEDVKVIRNLQVQEANKLKAISEAVDARLKGSDGH